MKTGVLVVLLMISQSALSMGLIRNAGVKLGYVSSTWTNYAWSSRSGRDIERYGGIDVGAFVEWLEMPIFSLLTEVHFIRKGVEFVNQTGWQLGVLSPRADYLSFPILAKARFLDQSFSPYIVGGPRGDVLLRFGNLGGVPEMGGSSRFNFGATVGIGVEVRAFEFAQLGIEFRYSPDLTDAFYPSGRCNSMEFLIVAGF